MSIDTTHNDEEDNSRNFISISIGSETGSQLLPLSEGDSYSIIVTAANGDRYVEGGSIEETEDTSEEDDTNTELPYTEDQLVRYIETGVVVSVKQIRESEIQDVVCETYEPNSECMRSLADRYSSYPETDIAVDVAMTGATNHEFTVPASSLDVIDYDFDTDD